MKKYLLALMCLLSIMALGGCDLFTDFVEYNVTGTSSSISVLYLDRDGDLHKVTASSPWQESFTLMSSSRPFMTYLRVTNSDAASAGIMIYVTVDGNQERTAPVAAGATGDIYFVVE